LEKKFIRFFNLQRTYYSANRLHSLFNYFIIIFLKELGGSLSDYYIKKEKTVFPMAINSKSIFLQP